jgi:hypothetical protein
MKNLAITLIIVFSLALITCKKEPPTIRFKNLTGATWVSDSLLANGADASGPGQILEKFKGELNFYANGTGNFGQYSGTWTLAYDDTQIILTTDSLPVPITTQIVELSSISLKVTTDYPNDIVPTEPIKIRMTFKSK